MNREIIPILIFITSFAAALFVLPKLAHLASRIGLLDHPNHRKVHKTPKPLVGGLGIVLSVGLTSLIFLPLSELHGFFAGLTLLTIVGVWDDFKELGHKAKFAAQIVAVGLMSYYSNVLLETFGDLLTIGSLDVPSHWLSFIITIFCTVGVINAINMIDGLDGLAGGVSFIAFIAFSVIAGLDQHTGPMLLSLAYGGAILGFLRYNWGPARLFMGDAGSLAIGFGLAYMSISITQGEGSLARPVTALLILALPISDTLTIMTKRAINGKNPFKADSHHLHHILLRYGFSKKASVKIILCLSIILGELGVVGSYYRIPDYFMFLSFMIFFGFYFTASFLIQDIMRITLRVRRKRGWYGENLLSTALKNFLKILDMFGIVRKKTRQKVQLNVTCSDTFDEGVAKSFNGRIVDLSRGGFMAWLPGMKYVRDNMKVQIFIPTKDGEFTLDAIAENLWISEVGNTSCYHGFKFIVMEDSRAKVLTDYLKHIASRSPRTFSVKKLSGQSDSSQLPEIIAAG